MRCPICNRRRAGTARHCSCDYNFESNDTSLAVMALESAAHDAGQRWRLGVGLLVVVPIIWVALGIALGDAASSIALTFLSVTGAGLVAWGVVGSLRTRRQLRAARKLHELPVARIVT